MFCRLSDRDPQMMTARMCNSVRILKILLMDMSVTSIYETGTNETGTDETEYSLDPFRP